MELMNNLYTVQHEQGSEAWHGWRESGIGATDAAAIIGASKWSTPLSVYAKKKGLAKPTETTSYQEWGNRIESSLVDKFMEMHSDTCTDCKRGRLFADGWKHCSLDAECLWHTRGDNGEVVEPVIIECKTSRDIDDWAPVPLGYYAQVQWQMGITGAKRAFFSVLITTSLEWIEREVKFDPEYFKTLVEACTLFWEHNIGGNIPPEPAHVLADVDKDAMNQISASTGEEPVDVELTEAEVEKYKYLKQRAEEAEAAFGAYKTDLQYRMLGGGALKSGGKKFAYWVSRSGSTSIDKAKLKAQFPDAFEACCKVGPGTRYVTFSSKL